ncbi:MOSC ferredoxin--Oxidoreductase [Candidatus Koribacter versatilis Ellin345]|uniref:nitric oxide dioxygenase n=1 Tax=Koribacter versatilis (strain Ellin345) TaxID=204669 RepID=Q1IN89_KORVE|nr:MOSC and FAD-binding oxidoreductase domain-containing protein [Candidatus Koribacter versatilis]ABF41661.1 MOSC ferredoxin--Oxidoreductase [Candidatus Koribacter versatilis Ellin345]
MPSLISVNVGLPRDVEWQGNIVHTAIWKKPVSGKVLARRLNLAGDGQGDLAGHGGEHRAVMVYQLDSYRYWQEQLHRDAFEYGQFGENFTVDGLPDTEVCIGDRYRIGSALFEVTQPRVTCYRVGIRMNEPQMAALLVSHKRPGFYLRVIEEGEVSAGDAIVKVADGPEHVTVADIDALLYLPGHSREVLKRALQVPALSNGWKSSLEAMLNSDQPNGSAGLITVAPPPAWRGFRPLRVAEVHRETADVLSFVLASPDGEPLPVPLAGQFLIFKLEPGAHSAPILRNYSISSANGEGTYRVSVKRDSGDGSRYFHDHIHAGDVIQVGAPRGTFTLAHDEKPIVLLSAGIGATPVLSMLYSLVATDTAREIWWCYGARNSQEHPFASEVHALLSKLPNSHSIVAYSKPLETDRPGTDYNDHGHLDRSLLEAHHVPKLADFYLCGPSAFMAQITATLQAWGVPSDCIHSEIFGTVGAITPGIAATTLPPPHPPSGAIGTGHIVAFTRSGLTVPWNEKYKSLLEFAEACAVPVRWSCRTGVCHMCESGLIAGTVKYAPDPLDPPADGNILLCCSTPLSEIELDL